MNTTPVNPFPSVAAQLTSPEAVAFYKSTALEVFYCFVEGLTVLMAGTIRAGQVTRELIHSAHQVILEINRKPQAVLVLPAFQPIALLPAVSGFAHHPDTVRAWGRVQKTSKQLAYALTLELPTHGPAIPAGYNPNHPPVKMAKRRGRPRKKAA
jgi:hypothetical protein